MAHKCVAGIVHASERSRAESDMPQRPFAGANRPSVPALFPINRPVGFGSVQRTSAPRFRYQVGTCPAELSRIRQAPATLCRHSNAKCSGPLWSRGFAVALSVVLGIVLSYLYKIGLRFSETGSMTILSYLYNI